VILRRFMCLLCAAHSSLAFAYRPFDSTDASVAASGEFELELGTSYLQERRQDILVFPSFVMNYGIGSGRELVVEGEMVSEIDGQNASHSRVADPAMSLKQLLRRGSLQGTAGLSLASECGVLLPAQHDEDVGAACALIGSHRWETAAVHVNTVVTFDRERQWNESVHMIVEGPEDWRTRPVLEMSLEWESGDEPLTVSVLLGLILQANQALSFDTGVRYEQTGGSDAWEIRAGLTWAR
jgi:hypothetical protein